MEGAEEHTGSLKKRAQTVSLALVLVLLVVGSVVFHFLSPWWLTPIASNWDYIDHTIDITFWITGVAFVAIIIIVAYCVFRFRHQGAGGTLRAGEQKTRVVAHDRHYSGGRGPAGSGLDRLA